jgi:hypothetical protein
MMYEQPRIDIQLADAPKMQRKRRKKFQKPALANAQAGFLIKWVIAQARQR